MATLQDRAVTVRLAAPLKGVDQVHKVIDNVLGHLGCAACLSGFDIRFTHEFELAVNPRTFEVGALAVAR
jgi:hypothetical protein